MCSHAEVMKKIMWTVWQTRADAELSESGSGGASSSEGDSYSQTPAGADPAALGVHQYLLVFLKASTPPPPSPYSALALSLHRYVGKGLSGHPIWAFFTPFARSFLNNAAMYGALQEGGA